MITTFGLTELRYRHKQAEYSKVVDATKKGSGCILTIEKDLPEVSFETFLFLTGHGSSSLAIFEGYVLDIGTFREIHPGEQTSHTYGIATASFH